jgi:hypothetical protein
MSFDLERILESKRALRERARTIRAAAAPRESGPQYRLRLQKD